MADVKTAPRIRCDNCGDVRDKVAGSLDGNYVKPGTWGELRMVTGRKTDDYGGVEKLVFPDLCEKCARAAGEAVHAVLLKLRGEGFDGPTGAE